MLNRANEYPEKVLCPLVNEWIEDVDCIENQDCVHLVIKEDTLPQKYKNFSDWREICQKCKYHEYE